MIEKIVQSKNQSKLIKSVTSCDGHLARVDISMYYGSVNTCQDHEKLCILKVQDDVQLVMKTFVCQLKISGPSSGTKKYWFKLKLRKSLAQMKEREK